MKWTNQFGILNFSMNNKEPTVSIDNDEYILIPIFKKL